MTPADRIIVALDVSNYAAINIAEEIERNTEVRFFKISASNLLDFHKWNIIEAIKDIGAEVMLDLKVYDTPDSVYRIVSGAFAAGVKFVTVHPECVIPAQKVLEEMPNWGDGAAVFFPFLN
jgi:orotidine-5'-phosphate decarboxylase